MGTKIKDKLFDVETEKLIREIASQYVEIFKIVKKACPKDFSTEQITLLFLKTEGMFNSIQVQKYKKQKKKNHNSNGNGNGKTKIILPKQLERNTEYYA